MSNGIRPAGTGPTTAATTNEMATPEKVNDAGPPQESTSPETSPAGYGDGMRGDLGFSGQMREMMLRDALPASTPSIIPQGAVAQASPSGDPSALRMKTLPAALEKANVPQKLKDDLMAQLSAKSGADLKQALDKAEAALKTKDPAGELKGLVLQGKIDAYKESFTSTYVIGGKQVKAAPHFRMTNGASGPAGRTDFASVRADLKKLIQAHDKGKPQDQQLWNNKMHEAIKMVAGGKGSAEQVKMVTEALIKSGEFEKAKAKHPGLSDADTIRMMQWDHGVGIDCAGYVSQAFVAAHGGKPGDYKLQEVNNENLMYLKNNPRFQQVKPVDIKPGDLIALNPPKGESVGHTVLVRDHRVATNEERNKFVHNDSNFEKRSDRIHIYEVDASWGAGQDGKLTGGLQRRIFIYNETTGKWGEATPDAGGDWELTSSTTNGPYDHPMNGIFRPK